MKKRSKRKGRFKDSLYKRAILIKRLDWQMRYVVNFKTFTLSKRRARKSNFDNRLLMSKNMLRTIRRHGVHRFIKLFRRDANIFVRHRLLLKEDVFKYCHHRVYRNLSSYHFRRNFEDFADFLEKKEKEFETLFNSIKKDTESEKLKKKEEVPDDRNIFEKIFDTFFDFLFAIVKLLRKLLRKKTIKLFLIGEEGCDFKRKKKKKSKYKTKLETERTIKYKLEKFQKTFYTWLFEKLSDLFPNNPEMVDTLFWFIVKCITTCSMVFIAFCEIPVLVCIVGLYNLRDWAVDFYSTNKKAFRLTKSIIVFLVLAWVPFYLWLCGVYAVNPFPWIHPTIYYVLTRWIFFIFIQSDFLLILFSFVLFFAIIGYFNDQDDDKGD